jgi:hypothetical protein
MTRLERGPRWGQGLGHWGHYLKKTRHTAAGGAFGETAVAMLLMFGSL